MSKKQLKTEGIINELRGASAFFPAQPGPVERERGERVRGAQEPALQEERIAQPATTSEAIPYQSPAPTPVSPSVTLPVQSPVPPVARTPVPHRHITRYAFEFYQDQIETLRAMSLEEKMQGEKGSMSEMVREALDAYIAKHTQQG